MHRLGLVAFVITTGVLVPAAVHQLSAGSEQVAKFVAPDVHTLALDGASIDARLDRVVADPGGEVKLHLDAHHARGKRLKVGVLVLASTGSEGERVPTPPVAIAHQTVTVPIDATGAGAADVALTLDGATVTSWGPPFARYTVMVLRPAAADRLARLNRGAKLVGGDEGIPSYNASAEKFMTLYGQGGELTGNDAKLFAEGAVARIDAYTRAINPAIAIATPDRTESGRAFTVAVTVDNPSDEPIAGLEVTLDTPTGVTEVYADDEDADAGGAIVMPDARTIAVAPHAHARVEFRVMASGAGVVGLYARARCAGDDACAPDALIATGTFDATEIYEPGPTVVGAR